MPRKGLPIHGRLDVALSSLGKKRLAPPFVPGKFSQWLVCPFF